MKKNEESFDMNLPLDEVYRRQENCAEVKSISMEEARLLPLGNINNETMELNDLNISLCSEIIIPFVEVEPLDISCSCRKDMQFFDEYCIGKEYHQIFRCGLCNIEKDVCFKVSSETFRDLDGNEIEIK